MIIPKKSEIRNSHIKLFFRAVVMMINQLIFKGIKISFHRGIIIRAAGTAHALSNTVYFTEFCKLF